MGKFHLQQARVNFEEEFICVSSCTRAPEAVAVAKFVNPFGLTAEMCNFLG